MRENRWRQAGFRSIRNPGDGAYDGPGRKDLRICNVLALGKTGAGKTSLLNYLYGFNLPVGAGMPKTGKGLHENVLVRNAVAYHVYDTWGIEADSLPEWRKTVLSLVGERNRSANPADWFHAVYYCFSANSGRIEEAELGEVVAPLLNTGCKVVIILTNAEPGFRKEEKLQGMRDYLEQRLKLLVPGKELPRIIAVNSVAGTSLGGDVAVRFGREEVLDAARYNLAEDIRDRLPCIYRENVKSKITAWKARSLLLLANGKISLLWNNNSAKKMVDMVNFDLQNTFSAIDADGDRLEDAANRYLAELAQCSGELPRGVYLEPRQDGVADAGSGAEDIGASVPRMDPRWRPEFRRITYVGGYEFTGDKLADQVSDFLIGLVRTDKNIRDNLTRKVEHTWQVIMHSIR